MTRPLLFLFTLFLIACGVTQPNNNDTSTTTEGETVEQSFWVAGTKSTCNAGVGSYECMVISEGTDLYDTDWTFFYDHISGFEHKPGTMQLVRVRRTERIDDPIAPVMDASPYTYSLIKVMKQQPDATLNLNGEYVLTEMAGQPVGDRDKVPTLMIDLEKRTVSGNNSCNQYNGSIVFLSPNSLALDQLATTKKMCRDAAMEQQFNTLFREMLRYELSGNTLRFMNPGGKTVLVFETKR